MLIRANLLKYMLSMYLIKLYKETEVDKEPRTLLGKAILCSYIYIFREIRVSTLTVPRCRDVTEILAHIVSF